MKKLKVKKSVSKRFRVTKKGKVLHVHQNRRHLVRKKSSKVKRRHKEPGILSKAFAGKIKKMLGEA